MRAASRKSRGRPALVLAWDDGRGTFCWYEARSGAPERALRDRCRLIFGARERARDLTGHGGYGLQAHGRGRKNRERERLWLSPHCLRADAPRQLGLLGEEVASA